MCCAFYECSVAFAASHEADGAKLLGASICFLCGGLHNRRSICVRSDCGAAYFGAYDANAQGVYTVSVRSDASL